VRYINWNIKCKSNIEKIIELIKDKADKEKCIIALQEVMPDAANALKNVFSKDYKILYSLDLREPGKFDTDNRRLGIMLLVSDDYEICEWDVMDRAIFPERTLDAIISDKDNKAYEILVLHSLTGVSFKMKKGLVDFKDGKFELIMIHMPKDLIQMGEIINSITFQDYDTDLIEFMQVDNATFNMPKNLNWTLDGEKGIGDSVIEIKNLHNALNLIK